MATLQNIGILKYRDKDGNWHPLPVVLQSSGGGSGGVSTISGKGQPGTSTVGRLNQLYRDESTDKLYICTSDTGGSYTWATVVSDTENAVTYTAQTLTNAQKQQARTNIGAGTSNFSGSYNDLTNKPNIPAASVIDTTLTQSGQAADAKAVGDALADKADTAAVNSALANKANTTDVNSALANKVDTTTLNTELAKKADTSAIPNVPAWALAASKPTYTASEVGALPNTTVIPDVSGKLDKAQGTANAGKFMGVGNDGNITPVDKPTYTLPVATASVLGGVKPIAKTSAMTQDVGVDSAGKLYTAPSSGGSGGTDKSLGITSATVGQIAKITAVDTSGKPTAWEAVDETNRMEWKKICDIVIGEDDDNVAALSTSTMPDGTPLSELNIQEIIFAGYTQIEEASSYSYCAFFVNDRSVIVGQNFNTSINNKTFFRGQFALIGDGYATAEWNTGAGANDRISGGGIIVNAHYYGANMPEIEDRFNFTKITSIKLTGPKSTSGVENDIKLARLLVYGR